MLPLDGRRAGVHRTRVEYISNSEVPPEQLAAALGQERWQQIGVAAARAMERLRSLIEQDALYKRAVAGGLWLDEGSKTTELEKLWHRKRSEAHLEIDLKAGDALSAAEGELISAAAAAWTAAHGAAAASGAPPPSDAAATDALPTPLAAAAQAANARLVCRECDTPPPPTQQQPAVVHGVVQGGSAREWTPSNREMGGAMGVTMGVTMGGQMGDAIDGEMRCETERPTGQEAPSPPIRHVDEQPMVEPPMASCQPSMERNESARRVESGALESGTLESGTLESGALGDGALGDGCTETSVGAPAARESGTPRDDASSSDAPPLPPPVSLRAAAPTAAAEAAAASVMSAAGESGARVAGCHTLSGRIGSLLGGEVGFAALCGFLGRMSAVAHERLIRQLLAPIERWPDAGCAASVMRTMLAQKPAYQLMRQQLMRLGESTAERNFARDDNCPHSLDQACLLVCVPLLSLLEKRRLIRRAEGDRCPICLEEVSVCKTKKRASHTNMFANISHRKKETEKESQTHVCPYRTAHVTPHFPHHITDMYHRHTSLREPRATHSPHLSRPILPICQPTFAFFSRLSPIFPMCHSPFSLYITDIIFLAGQAGRGVDVAAAVPPLDALGMRASVSDNGRHRLPLMSAAGLAVGRASRGHRRP